MVDKYATRVLPAVANACHLVGGRRHYNARRRAQAEARRARIVKRLVAVEFHKRGWQAEIARQLGVNRSTIHRDLAAIRQAARQVARSRRDEFAVIRATIGERLHRSLAEGNEP